MADHGRSKERADEVLGILSEAVMKIGPILEDQVAAGDFDDWVLEYLPLQVSTAQRILAMWHLHEFKAGHPDLPAPFKALWDLT